MERPVDRLHLSPLPSGPRRTGVLSVEARPVAAALTLAIVLLAGCGLIQRAEPTPAPTPIDVRDVLRLSGEATAALDTFHFTLEHNDVGGTPLTETLEVTEASGDVVSPDRISVEFAGTFGRFAVRSSLVTLGEASYMTNPLSGAWEAVSREVSPLGFFDPQQGIGAMMAQLQSPVLASRSDGEYRIDGTLPVLALRPLLGDAAQGTTVDVELTIDTETLYLKKAVIDGRVTAIEVDGIVRTIELSDFNAPILIDAPTE